MMSPTMLFFLSVMFRQTTLVLNTIKTIFERQFSSRSRAKLMRTYRTLVIQKLKRQDNSKQRKLFCLEWKNHIPLKKEKPNKTKLMMIKNTQYNAKIQIKKIIIFLNFKFELMMVTSSLMSNLMAHLSSRLDRMGKSLDFRTPRPLSMMLYNIWSIIESSV